MTNQLEHDTQEQARRHTEHPVPLTSDDLEVIRNTAVDPRPRGRGVESPDGARDRGLVDIALVSIMHDGLLRAGEAVNLRWEDVSRYEDGSASLHIRFCGFETCRGGSLVPLPPETMEALNAIRPDPCVSERRIFEMTSWTVSIRIRRMAQAAGLGDGYTGYSPRMGMVVDLTRSGFSMAEIAQAARVRGYPMGPISTPQNCAPREVMSAFHARALRDGQDAGLGGAS